MYVQLMKIQCVITHSLTKRKKTQCLSQMLFFSKCVTRIYLGWLSSMIVSKTTSDHGKTIRYNGGLSYRVLRLWICFIPPNNLS